MQIGFSQTLGAALFLIGVGVGCASAPKPIFVVSEQEQRARDTSLGSQIAQDFESELRLRHDIELQVFFRRIAENLSASDSILHQAPVGVFIVDDKKGRWQNYGLPGNRIYLSAGLLRGLRYENEVAAAIALELAHIRERSLVGRLEAHAAVEKDYFSNQGVFAYSDQQWGSAVAVAVHLMYAAGYDPRGITALCDRYIAVADHSPLNAEAIDRLREKTRSEIARLSPLRNPVVRSEEFIRLQRRMEKL